MDKFSKCHCLRFLAFGWEGCVPLGRQIHFIPAAKLLICSSFLKYCVEKDSEAVYRLIGKDLCIINNNRCEHGRQPVATDVPSTCRFWNAGTWGCVWKGLSLTPKSAVDRTSLCLCFVISGSPWCLLCYWWGWDVGCYHLLEACVSSTLWEHMLQGVLNVILLPALF